jgi:glutaminase
MEDEQGGSTPPMGRSRVSSMGEDLDMRTLEQDLFGLCKGKSEDKKADAGLFLRLLGKCGILRSDPRLDPVMEALHTIRKKSLSTIMSGVDHIKLDFNQFRKVIQGSTILISKTFKGQLVIPEFGKFCQDIDEIYKKCSSYNKGKPADYIPQLARYDPAKWGVSLCTIDGQRYSIGDVTDTFTIQSSSKPITYAICLDELGSDEVHQYLGREPSGRVFNEIVLDYNDMPHNPMVNSGAIMSASLLLYKVKPELSLSEKYEYVHNFFKRMCGGLSVGFMNSVFLSERDTADRNFALAYYMRELNCFPKGPEGPIDIRKVLEFYFQTCSLEMNAESMSVLAATLASGGICPITGERVLKSHAVRHVLSLMHSCGMYNYSGQFSFKVGLPAKSGVSGVIIVVVPNVVGFALWSPSLDGVGNSARGVMFCEELVKIYNFHRFDSVDQCNKKDPTVSNYEQISQHIIQLLLAASNGDVTALERAHLQGFDMNMGDYDGRTALHLAAAEGHTGCVKFLIEKCKVNVECQDRWGQTPMEEATRFGRSRVVAILYKYLTTNRSRNMRVLSEKDENGDQNDTRNRKDNKNAIIEEEPESPEEESEPKGSLFEIVKALNEKNAKEAREKEAFGKIINRDLDDDKNKKLEAPERESPRNGNIRATTINGTVVNGPGITVTDTAGSKRESTKPVSIYIDPTNPDVVDISKTSLQK